jgi:hypothetical protein
VERPVTRRIELTDELKQTILESFDINPSIESAAAKAHIHPSTLRSWLVRGSEGDETYEQLSIEAAALRNKWKDELVQSLFEIATDRLHPQATKAAQQLLSAMHPTEFATVRHTVSHKAEREPEVDLTRLSKPELREFMKTLRKLKSGDEEPKREPAPNVVDVVEVKK